MKPHEPAAHQIPGAEQASPGTAVRRPHGNPDGPGRGPVRQETW